VVGDYRAARDSVTLMLATIKETVANANRDVSMTSDVVARIEAAAQKLATAQNQADRYLDDVTEVIAESHQRFADGMRKTVAEANTAFHQQLAQATGLLSTAIQELEEALPVGRR
jgi:DNA-binding GntR family transcriptional regulator